MKTNYDPVGYLYGSGERAARMNPKVYGDKKQPVNNKRKKYNEESNTKESNKETK